MSSKSDNYFGFSVKYLVENAETIKFAVCAGQPMHVGQTCLSLWELVDVNFDLNFDVNRDFGKRVTVTLVLLGPSCIERINQDECHRWIQLLYRDHSLYHFHYLQHKNSLKFFLISKVP